MRKDNTKLQKVVNIINTLIFTLFIGTMITMFVVTPDEKISISEKRNLAQVPVLNLEEIETKKFMDNLENYTLDQFPYRDTFRKIKTYFELDFMGKSDSSGYTTDNGHVHKVDYELHSQNIEKTLGKIMKVAAEINESGDKDIYISIIPDKSYYNDKIQTLDYNDAFKIIYQNIDGLKYIDITGELMERDYYYTDLHWKQENIVKIANKLLTELGKSEISKDNYTEKAVTDKFNGSYGSASAFSISKDTITILTNDKLDSIKVFDYETNKYMDVYTLSKAEGIDPYDTYLGGAKSLLRMENPNSLSDEKLIIFRDSFTSSLAPLLVDEYSEILLVDLRYINYNYLSKIIDLKQYDDALFLYNIIVLNESESFKF